MNVLEAISQNDANILRELLTNGANANEIVTFGGKTALHYALGSNAKLEIISLLLEQGANIKAVDFYDVVPLHAAAASHRNPEVISMLLDAGADIEAVDNYGKTALHYAVESNDEPAITQKLLEKGANVHAENAANSTPLHVDAENSNNPLKTQMLIKAGAKVNAVDYLKRTPLHVAGLLNENFKEVALALITNGANLKALDNEGQSPLAIEKIKNAFPHHADHQAAGDSLQEILATNNEDNTKMNALNIVLQQQHDVFTPALAQGNESDQNQNTEKPIMSSDDSRNRQNDDRPQHEKDLKQLTSFDLPMNHDKKGLNGRNHDQKKKQNAPKKNQRPTNLS